MAEKNSNPIGIMLPSSAEFVIAMFAVMRLGRGFVPLDPELPHERLRHIIAECKIDVIIYDAGKSQSDHFDEKVKVIDIKEAFSSPATNKIIDKSTPESLVYIIYTSGSTGIPKGIPITHRNLAPLMLWQKAEFSLSPKIKLMQTLSLSFDFGIQEILTTILFGGQLFVSHPTVKISADAFVKYINKESINMLYTTPSHLNILSGFEEMPSLKVVLVGGEAFSIDIYKKFRQKTSLKCNIYNGYGPTEASINATMHLVTDDIFDTENDILNTIPIGLPSANNTVYLFDNEGWAVPPYVTGEIYIGGPGVSSGYVNNEELNSEKFVTNPHFPCGNLYRTGDYARYTSEGVIEFLGRKDEQVKIRGHRVDVMEVEKTIFNLLNVTWLAVTAVRDQGNNILVLFILKSECLFDKKELDKLLKNSLPSYMIPTHIVKLDQVPLNNNSKLDKKQLLIFFEEQRRKKIPFEGYSGNLSENIAHIWEEILELNDEIGIYDNIFDLGAHSMLLPKAHSKIEELTNSQLTISDLFNNPTPFLQAKVIEKNYKISATDVNDFDNEHRTTLRKNLTKRSRIRRIENEAK